MSLTRRTFLKGLATGIGASMLPLSFSSRLFAAGQTYSVIEVFLYGGASSAVSELKVLADANVMGYTANNKTQTSNGFWNNAGGVALENLISKNRLTMISVVPWHSSKAHDFAQSYGTLGQASNIPDSIAFAAVGDGGKALVGRNQGYFPFDSSLSNPYVKGAEEASILDLYSKQNSRIHTDFVSAGQTITQAQTLKTNFEGSNNNLNTSNIAQQLRAAVALIQSQNKTHFISIPLGGWDMHSNSDNQYIPQMKNLLEGVQAASDMIDQAGLPIVIVVRGDFGRNYHYNDSNGWDHGDHQIMLLAGGGGFVNHKGKYFESTLDGVDITSTRVYSKPTGNYPVLDLSEARVLQLELMGVTVEESVQKVANNSFMWSLSFPEADRPNTLKGQIATEYQRKNLSF